MTAVPGQRLRLACSLGYYGGLSAVFFLAGGWAFQQFGETPLPPGRSPDGQLWMGVSALGALLFVVVSARHLAAIHRRRWQAGTLLFGVVFASTLLLAELLARCFVPAWPALGLHGVPPETASRSWSRSAGAPSDVGINSWGQRDRERTPRPAAGRLRIAFIGDSFLEESVGAPLSIRVEERLARTDVEILNLGVSATSPDEYFDRLQQIALPLGATHCVAFVFAGNDLVDDERTLESWGGVAAVYPRRSFLQSLGMLGVNHLLTNSQRPVLQAWLHAGDLRRLEEYRGQVIANTDPAALPGLLLGAAALPPAQHAALARRLQSPEMSGVFAMLQSPDDGRFRSYYLVEALQAAAEPGRQWPQNSEVGAVHWMRLAAATCARRNVPFSVVIIPEGCQVDSRMAAQWGLLADMRRLTQPCRDAAVRLRDALRTEGIDVLDLHEPLQDIPGTYLNVDGHWSESGVDAVADILGEHLQPWLNSPR